MAASIVIYDRSIELEVDGVGRAARPRRRVTARSGSVLNFSKRWRVLGSAARDSNPSRVSRHLPLFIDDRSI